MNQETKRTKLSVHDLVQLSVLIAIMLLLELTGLGMIKTAGLEITIMLVPVIVGAIVMGPAAGALLGGVFGLISFWECWEPSSWVPPPVPCWAVDSVSSASGNALARAPLAWC